MSALRAPGCIAVNRARSRSSVGISSLGIVLKPETSSAVRESAPSAPNAPNVTRESETRSVRSARSAAMRSTPRSSSVVDRSSRSRRFGQGEAEVCVPLLAKTTRARGL